MAWSQIASLKGDQGDPGPPPNIRVQGGVIQWRAGNAGDWSDLIELSELEGEDGADGQDGTGVTILGSYDTVEDLEAAHPTGEPGEAYLVAGDLFVWSEDGSEWANVGNIQGPPGRDGTDGVPVEFSTSDGWLRYRLVGSGPSGWDNLVELEDLRGPAGADGSDGEDGSDGQRGTGWHTGEGPPGDLPDEIVGDLYLETDTGTVWLLEG